MKIKLSKSQWNSLKKQASVPLTEKQRQQMAKEGVFVLLNSNNALPNLSKTQVDAVVEELKNSGATEFFKQLDVKNVLQLPYIYKLDKKSIVEIDGQQYLVLDVDEGRDVKKKSTIDGVVYEKGQRYPGKIVCTRLDNGSTVVFPLDDIVSHIRRPGFIREETLREANEAIKKHNERIKAIENAAGATKLVLQIESVKIEIQDRLNTLDRQIDHFSKMKENPVSISPSYASWIEYLRNGIKDGLFTLKDTFDTILFLYQTNPEDIIRNIDGLRVPEEIKPGLVNIANKEIEKRKEQELKDQAKHNIIEEQMDQGVSEEKDIQEQPLSPLTPEDIPESPYKKSTKYKTLYHWASSLDRIIDGIVKDKKQLEELMNSFNGMEKYLAEMKKGTRSAKFLSSPEGKSSLDALVDFLNKSKIFINRYIINIVEDGKINSRLLGRMGSPGNAVLAIDLHKLYNVIQKTLSGIISSVPSTTGAPSEISSPVAIPETVATVKGEIKTSKTSSNDCGGFKPPKGHLDTQMFPECEGTETDRDIVKKTEKTEEKRKKEKKMKQADVSVNIKLSSALDKLEKASQNRHVPNPPSMADINAFFTRVDDIPNHSDKYDALTIIRDHASLMLKNLKNKKSLKSEDMEIMEPTIDDFPRGNEMVTSFDDDTIVPNPRT